MKNCRIIVVEDEVIIRKFVISTLMKLGCEIVGESSSGERALELVKMEDPDLVLMDVKLAGKIDGIEAAMEISLNSSARIAFMSAYDHIDILKGKNIPNCIAYLEKPVEVYNLQSMLDKLQ